MWLLTLPILLQQTTSAMDNENIITQADCIRCTVEVYCGFSTGVPFWIINGSVYDFNKMMPTFAEWDSTSYSLFIPKIRICLNSTTFQCFTSDKDSYYGRITKLIVIPTSISHSSSSFCESDMGTLSQDLMTLQIDLSTLIINNSFISFEWINSFNCNESDISLQTYKNITTSIQQFSSKCCDNFFASSEDQNDETSFFKLSVVSGDVNCNYHPYQHFFEDKPTKIHIQQDTSLCLPFPESTAHCDFNNTALFMAISHNCIIRVNSEIDVNNYACYKNLRYFQISATFNNQICLSNLSVDYDRTLVFMCMEKCIESNCEVVYNYVSSHMLKVKVNDDNNKKELPNHSLVTSSTEPPTVTLNKEINHCKKKNFVTEGLLGTINILQTAINIFLVILIIMLIIKLKKVRYQLMLRQEKNVATPDSNKPVNIEKNIGMTSCPAYQKVSVTARNPEEMSRMTVIYETL